MRLKKTREGQKGFTIIELLITLAVVSVIAGASAPAFKGMIDRNTLRKVSSDFVISLLYARSEAVKRNMEVSVAPTGGDWSMGWYVFVNDTKKILRNFDATKNIVAKGPTVIVFSASGRTEVNENNQLKLLLDDRLRCVYVSVTGQSTVLNDNDRDGNCANG